MPKLTPELITAAIEGYEAQKSRIEAQLAELRAMQSGGPAKPAATTTATTKPKPRKMSAAGRKAISDATKKRWAAFHAANQAEKPEPVEPEVAVANKATPKKMAVKKTPTKKAATKKAVAKKTALAVAPAENEA